MYPDLAAYQGAVVNFFSAFKCFWQSFQLRINVFAVLNVFNHLPIALFPGFCIVFRPKQRFTSESYRSAKDSSLFRSRFFAIRYARPCSENQPPARVTWGKGPPCQKLLMVYIHTYITISSDRGAKIQTMLTHIGRKTF